MDPNARQQCPECGADLTVRKAVHFGQYRKRPRTIIAGSIIAGLPILLILAMILPAVFGFRWRDLQPNSWVIERLATTSGPWDWRIVEQRYNQGRLSKEEVAATIDQLINYTIDDRKKGNNGPLHWCDDYLEQLMSDGAISDEQFARLRDAFYGSMPRVNVRQRIKAGQRLSFRIDYGGPWDLPTLKNIKALRQLTLDGQEKLKPFSEHRPNDPDYLTSTGPFSIDGCVDVDAPVGKHELQFEVDLGLIADKRVSFTTGDGIRPGQVKRWPTPNHRWTRTVSVPLTIVASDEQLIEMIDDPALDPVKSKQLSVRSIIMKPDHGKVQVIITVDQSEHAATPVSFDVGLRIQGREHAAGYIARSIRGDRGYGIHPIRLDSLDPTIRRVDVVLRPNPQWVMNWPTTTSIWGKPIEFKDVPIERDDLDRTDE